MLVSEFYKLGRSQPTLDFVDVDIENDTPVFVSPRALTELNSEWGDECVFLVQNFFQRVLELIRTGQNNAARSLLRVLREPNETHLGLSKEKAQGKALGWSSANDVWQALSESEAAKSGLLRDLEDTVLMVEGISIDIVSDITTNIIRLPLIEYTQKCSEQYGIPLQVDVNSGPLWEPHKQEWYSRFTRLPVANNQKLLLVPKAIVRRHLSYDPGEYYRHYLLEHLREVELSANSELVHVLRDGRRRVTKKSLMEKYGAGKEVIVRETKRYPNVLEAYRHAKANDPHLPLSHEALAAIENRDAPDWHGLLQEVVKLRLGAEDADAYEKSVEGLLTALFYPVLTNPSVQHRIHEGRKRIDIAYSNMATAGFFSWLAKHYAAARVFVECKNYSRELGNPELDQLSGRFSPSRGQFGFIVCRGFENKDNFLERCRDTAKDTRGYIVPLDDDDLKQLVESRINDVDFLELPLIWNRLHRLLD